METLEVRCAFCLREARVGSPEMIDSRIRANLRILGADIERLPEIPPDLATYIASLTLEDLARLKEDVRELERLGLIPKDERKA
jgi:hypothetical protein